MSAAELRAKGLDVKITGDKYESQEDSIATGTVDHEVDLAALTSVTSLEILNDTSGKDLTVKLNAGGGLGDSFTVKGEESKVIDQYLIKRIALSNASGSSINYRLLMWGI